MFLNNYNMHKKLKHRLQKAASAINDAITGIEREEIERDTLKSIAHGNYFFAPAIPNDTETQSQHRGASTRPLERFEACQPTASSVPDSDAKTEINTLKKQVQEKANWVSRLLGELEEICEIDAFSMPRRERIDTLQYECENLSKMLADLLYQDRMLRRQNKS